MWWAAVLIVALCCFLGGFVRWGHATRELLRAARLLYEGDPEAFLLIVEAQRRWQGKTACHLNRAVASFWCGQFERALALLRETRDRRMSRSTRAAYDTCELAALIMLGRTREAEVIYAARGPSMRESGHPLTTLMCNGVEADLAFFGRGDLPRARALNEGLLAQPHLPPIAAASIHWTLAEIAAREGSPERARAHLGPALAGANRTFVAEKAAALRARLDGDEERQASLSGDAEDAPDSLQPVVSYSPGTRLGN